MDDVNYIDNTVPKNRILSTNKILREFIEYANIPPTYLTTQNQLLERIIISALKGVENRINFDLLYRRVRVVYNKLSKENQLPNKTIGVKNTPNESFTFTNVNGSAHIDPPKLGEEVVAPIIDGDIATTFISLLDTPANYARDGVLAANAAGTGIIFVPRSEIQGIQAPYKVELYATTAHGADAPQKPTTATWDGENFNNVDRGWIDTFPTEFDEAANDYWLTFAIYNPKTKLLGAWQAPHKIHGGIDVDISEVEAEIDAVSARLAVFEALPNTGAVETEQLTIFHDPKRISGEGGIPLYQVIDILKGADSDDKTQYTERQAGSFVSADTFRAPTTEDFVVGDETHEAIVISFPGNINEYKYLNVEFNDSDVQLSKTERIPVKTIANGFDWVNSDARPTESEFKRELRVRISYDADTDISQVKIHKESVPEHRNASTAIYLFIAYLIKDMARGKDGKDGKDGEAPDLTIYSTTEQIDDKDAVVLQDAKDYTYDKATIDSKDRTTLQSAQGYTYSRADIDSRDRTTLQSAQGFTYSRTDIDNKDSATLQSAQGYTYPKGTIDNKDANTLQAAKDYTDQEILSAELSGGDVEVDLSDYYTKTESDTNDANTLTSAQGYTYPKATIDSKDTAATNAANSATDTKLTRYSPTTDVDSKDAATLTAAKAYTDENAGDEVNAALESLISDMEWKVELRRHNRSGSPVAPATIGLSYTSSFLDLIFPNAITKEQIDALVLNRNFAFTVPQGVVTFTPTAFLNTGTINSQFHRERYSATFVLHGAPSGSDPNDGHQTTLYRASSADGKFINGILIDRADDDKIKLSYSDDSTGLELDWLPNPGNSDGSRTLMKVQRIGTEKRLLGSTTEDLYEDLNSLSDSASDTKRLKGQHIRSNSIPADRIIGGVGSGKFVDSVAVDDGKVVLGYNDDSTAIQSNLFIPNPGNAVHSRAILSAARNSAGKVNLVSTTTSDVTGSINSLSDSADNAQRIKGQHIQTNSIPEDRLNAATRAKLNAESDSGASKAIEALASDMEWKVEVQTYNNASAPASPATIGLGYKVFAFGQPNASHRIDFVFPTATSKADIDALVLNRKFVIEVPEGVITFEPTSHIATAVVSGGFHRERYDGNITPNFTGFTYNSDGNNDYQTTLYRGLESGVIEDGSITTAKLAPLAVTGPKLGTDAVTASKIAPGVITEAKLNADVQAKLNASASAFSGHGIVLTSLGTPTLLTSGTPQALTFTLPAGKNIRDYDRILFRMTGTGIKGEYFARGLEIDSSTSTAQIVLAGLTNVAELKIYSPTTNNITITNVGGFTPNIVAEIIAVDFTGEKGDTPSLSGYYTKAESDANDIAILGAAEDATYPKATIDSKDTATLNSAKADATTKANTAETNAKAFTFSQADITSKDSAVLTAANSYTDTNKGSTTFTGLTDTPAALTGQGGKIVQVNAAATALEFGDAPSGGGGLPSGYIYLAKKWHYEFNSSNIFTVTGGDNNFLNISATDTTKNNIGFGESLNNFSHMRIYGSSSSNGSSPVDSGIFEISSITTDIASPGSGIITNVLGLQLGKFSSGNELIFFAGSDVYLIAYELYKTAP